MSRTQAGMTLLLPVLALLGIVALGALGQARLAAPAAELGVPAPTAPPGRQAAIYPFVVRSQTVGSGSETVPSAAVLARGAPRIVDASVADPFDDVGPWEVRLENAGTPVAAFRVFDPRRLEIAPEGASPQAGITRTTAEWDLTVPLYRDGRILEMTDLRIIDDLGNEIYAGPAITEAGRARPIASPAAAGAAIVIAILVLVLLYVAHTRLMVPGDTEHESESGD